MKKLSLLTFAIIIIGCSKLYERPINDIVEISANIIATKTSIDGTTLSWSDEEKIGLFVDGIHDNCVLTNSGTGSTSSFLCRFNKKGVQPSTVNWYSYYPWQSSVSGNIVSAELPLSQSAPFDETANFMTASPVSHEYNEDGMTSLQLSFDNQLFGLIKLTVKDGSNSSSSVVLNQVEVSSDEGKAMTGSFSFNVTSPNTTLVFNGDKQSKVLAKYSAGVSIGSGQDIYMFVKPDDYTGLTVTVNTGNNEYRTFHTSSKVSVKAGDVTAFPAINISSKTAKPQKILACWGDSFTDAGYSSYPNNLQDVLGIAWKVYNGGISGDRVDEISARQGGLDIFTNEKFVLPASGSVTVNGILRSRNNACESGFYNMRRYRGAMANPCIIEVGGTKYYCNVNSSSTYPSGKDIDDPSATFSATITRLEPGSAVTVPEHTKIISYGAQVAKNADLQIIYMGTNGKVVYPGSLGDDHYYDNLVNYHKYMTNFNTKSSDYLILGYHTGSWNEYYWSRFTSEFGTDRMVDLRHIIPNKGRELMVLTGAYASVSAIPQSELDRIDAGQWPYCFWHTTTDVHPSEYGARAIAIVIHDRMVKLGYISDSYMLSQD